MQDAVHKEIAELFLDSLHMCWKVANNVTAATSYKHYDINIRAKYKVEIAGWPTTTPFINLTSISMDDLRVIRDDLKLGAIHWMNMTKSQLTELDIELVVLRKKCVSEGKGKGKDEHENNDDKDNNDKDNKDDNDIGEDGDKGDDEEEEEFDVDDYAAFLRARCSKASTSTSAPHITPILSEGIIQPIISNGVPPAAPPAAPPATPTSSHAVATASGTKCKAAAGDDRPSAKKARKERSDKGMKQGVTQPSMTTITTTGEPLRKVHKECSDKGTKRGPNS
ncbi:hypothetical protein C8J57DRAFT_1505218 [Mycena rebaudengoi]|nr:hypothetical protein C8J57DRAFT_1505218 [Mycena rebaudengoi]